jgi:FAD:protein FMN transferase
MGTGWSLEALAGRDVTDGALAKLMERVFALVIGQMSQWEPDSDLSRFNRAEPGSRHSLQREMAHVLDCALTIARATGGAFDPSLGEASELWGFGRARRPAAAPDGPAAAATRRYNWQDVAIEAGGRVLVQPGGLALDLSGIAKGFAVDAGVGALARAGIAHALLEIGGELRGAGARADGLPWWVDLEVPPGSGAAPTRIGLTGWSVATTGSYVRRRGADGRSWSHTLDPATGSPIGDDLLAVTVLHPGCMQADALATAIAVLGMEEGLRFAQENAIPTRIVTQNAVRESPAWRAWLD